MVEAVSEALRVWGEFASTGDVTAVESAFVEGGPQHRQLEAEARAWVPSGSSQPLRFVIRELRPRGLDAATATIWTRVEAARPGFQPRSFSWDFDLVLRDGRWRVWTVVAAEPPTPPVSEAVPEAPTTSATTETTLDELAASSLGEARSQTRGVRLPLLSAWIIVITIVVVAVAGYLAPRIDRRGEG